MDFRAGDIAHIIQLAIAPVFLLTGVGAMLAVLTNRLARIIDRTRVLDDRLTAATNDEDLEEMAVLLDRWHLINFAIGLATACGLLICLVIMALFIGGALGLAFGQFIAALFVFAMVALIGSFCYLLREILVASKNLRLRRHAYRHFDSR
jgi:hypothetical protein